MKNKISYITIILVSIIFLTACFDGNVYHSDTNNYSIKYPKGWTKQGKIMAEEEVIYSPKQGDDDKYIESISLLVEKGRDDRTLDEYFETAVRTRSRKIAEESNGQYIDETVEKTTLDGVDAYKLTYTTSMAGTNIKIYRYVAQYNEKFYVVSFNIQLEQNDMYVKDIDETISSFKFDK